MVRGNCGDGNKRAYFMFFKPRFLLKHYDNMPADDREKALALLD